MLLASCDAPLAPFVQSDPPSVPRVQAGPPAGPYDSPEATFATARGAAQAGEWKTFFGCLTPGAQRAMAAASLSITALAHGMSAATGQPNDQIAKIEAVFVKHGVSEEFFKRAESFSMPDSEELYRMVDKMPDVSAFLADLKAVSPRGGKTGALEDWVAQGTLQDAKVSGDSATAVVVMNKKKHPLRFQRIDGQWRIDMEPLENTANHFRRR
jgi:hypothetical protein